MVLVAWLRHGRCRHLPSAPHKRECQTRQLRSGSITFLSWQNHHDYPCPYEFCSKELPGSSYPWLNTWNLGIDKNELPHITWNRCGWYSAVIILTAASHNLCLVGWKTENQACGPGSLLELGIGRPVTPCHCVTPLCGASPEINSSQLAVRTGLPPYEISMQMVNWSFLSTECHLVPLVHWLSKVQEKEHTEPDRR